MKHPLVSIIIVSYAQEQYVSHSIRSAVNQTYDNIELIISDDASPDNTYEVILSLEDEIKAKIDKVKIIHNEVNQGLSRNLRNALTLAEGEWVKILYADDILPLDSVEACVDFTEKHPEYDMIHSSYYKCDEGGEYGKTTSYPGQVLHPIQTEVTPKSLFNYYFIISPTVFIKKNVYLESFDDSIGIDDWGTYLEVSLNHNIGYLDHPTVIFRILTNSMSHFASDEIGRSKFRKMVHNEFSVLDKYKDNPQVDKHQGISNCCEQAISLAIDLGFDDVIEEIKEYAEQNGCKMSLKMKVKHLFAKIGLLRTIQSVKRRMGLETGNA